MTKILDLVSNLYAFTVAFVRVTLAATWYFVVALITIFMEFVEGCLITSKFSIDVYNAAKAHTPEISKNAPGPLLLVLFVGALGANLIIINEEILVVLCFAVAVLFILGNFIGSANEAFEDRAEGIQADIDKAYFTQLDSIQEVFVAEKALLNTSRHLQSLAFHYVANPVMAIKQRKNKALCGFIGHHFDKKLDVLNKAVTGGNRLPVFHDQVSASFRVIAMNKLKKNFTPRNNRQRKYQQKVAAAKQMMAA